MTIAGRYVICLGQCLRRTFRVSLVRFHRQMIRPGCMDTTLPIFAPLFAKQLDLGPGRVIRVPCGIYFEINSSKDCPHWL